MMTAHKINANENELTQLYAEPASLLEQVLNATLASKPAPQPKPAPAQPKPQPAPQAPVVRPAARAGKSDIRSPRRQKLATTQIAAGRYAFSHNGCSCEVTNGNDGWRLTIDGVQGNRRYETKRHAVNSARVFLDNRAATIGKQDQRPAMKPAPQAPAAQPTTPAPQAGWRGLAMTGKQANMLVRLRAKLEADDLIPSSPLADKRRLTRGEASELIDAMKTQLGEPLNSMNRRRYRRSAAGPQVDTCSIGPFAGGYCLCCSKRQA